MLHTRLACVASLFLAGPLFAAEVTNGLVTVRTLESAAGSAVGFVVLDGSLQPVARVLLSSSLRLTGRATASPAGATQPSITFSGLEGLAGVDLGASHVRVSLEQGEACPLVDLYVEVSSFDVREWQAAEGTTPFHILALPLESAEVFHQRGWPIPTPAVDPYPMRQAIGPGRTVVSQYSNDWTYAPPVGAYPVPVAGLWAPASRRYVGYDFHEARLVRHVGDDVATAYCAEHGELRDFVALVLPYAAPYDALTYPSGPQTWKTAFHLIYSSEMGPDDDPNLFVMERAWRRYRDQLAAAPEVMDLSWYHRGMRPTRFERTRPGRLYDVAQPGAIWEEPGAITAFGVGYLGSGIEDAYAAGEQGIIKQLEEDIAFLLERTTWLTIAGDECCFWAKPLEGEMARMFGPGVGTLHTVQGWGVAQALLESYLGSGGARTDLLPYIDGALRYTKHILYTRNDYPDVPAAQFAWGAAPVAHFCYTYYHAFRDDPTRADLVALAHKLARTMTYRYLPIFQSDNIVWDDLDASWFMEPNSGLPWLGAACANEIWVVPVALAEVYCHTGDPIIKQCLSGMLERWHELARNEYAPTMADYTVQWAERYGLYPGGAQAHGTRAEYGGLWGGFEVLSWPVGDADVRVLLGEGGALCFNAEGEHTNIANVQVDRDGAAFTLVPHGTATTPTAGGLDVVVTRLYADLSRAPCAVERGGMRVTLAGGAELKRHENRPDTVTLSGLRHGDRVTVGKPGRDAPILDCAMAKPRVRPSGQPAQPDEGFAVVDLSGLADAALPQRWADLQSYAGLDRGPVWRFGVPFVLVDPVQNAGLHSVAASRIPAPPGYRRAFALVANAGPGARVVVEAAGGAKLEVPLADAVPVLRGWPPAFEWRVTMVELTAPDGMAAVSPVGCHVLAVTLVDETKVDVTAVERRLAARSEQQRAEQAALESLAALQPEFSRLSGRIALLPTPIVSPGRLSRLLHKAGLARYVAMPTPEDLVTPARFSAQEYWVTIVAGGEGFYETVRSRGDGLESLQRFLREGGTLLVLPVQPFPFFYNESGRPVAAAQRLGLPIAGGGLATGPLAGPVTTGWESPPEGIGLTFRVAPGQDVIRSIPEAFPWNDTLEQRWRPIFDPATEDVRYTPLISLHDESDRYMGDGAALLEFLGGPLKGGRALYVWCSLLDDPLVGQAILADVLRYTLSTAIAPPARATVPRATEAPTIDGMLDDQCWISPRLAIAHRAVTPGRAAYATHARLAWDNAALYIAFECEDPDLRGTLTQRDAPLWEEEVVEAFIDPDGDGREYREIEISPLGNVVDLNIGEAVDGGVPDPWPYARWDAEGLRFAVKAEGTIEDDSDTDRGWTVEMAIPWSDLGTAVPSVGQTMRLQLFRIDRSRTLEEPEFLSWSPTPLFHMPDRFGIVTLAPPQLDDDFSWYPDGSQGAPPLWSVIEGSWTVRQGVLIGENGGSNAYHAAGITRDTLAPNCTIRFRYCLESAGSDWRDGLWVGLRGTPDGGYTLELTDRSARLHKRMGAVSTGDTDPLLEVPFARDSAWHELFVRCDDATIEVLQDGVSLLRFVDRGALGIEALTGTLLTISPRKFTLGQGITRVLVDDVSIRPLR